MIVLGLTLGCSSTPKPIIASVANNRLVTNMQAFPHSKKVYNSSFNLKSAWYDNPIYSQPKRPYKWFVQFTHGLIKGFASVNQKSTQTPPCLIDLKEEYLVTDIFQKRGLLRLQNYLDQDCGWISESDLLLSKFPMMEKDKFQYFFPRQGAFYKQRSNSRSSPLFFHGFIYKTRIVKGQRWYFVSASLKTNTYHFKVFSGWVKASQIYVSDFSIVLSRSQQNPTIDIIEKNGHHQSPIFGGDNDPKIIYLNESDRGFEVLYESSYQFAKGWVSKDQIALNELTYATPILKETKRLFKELYQLLTNDRLAQFSNKVKTICSSMYTELNDLVDLCRDPKLHRWVMSRQDSEVESFLNDEADGVKRLDSVMDIEEQTEYYEFKLEENLIQLDKLNNANQTARSDHYEWTTH
jgi:hypothetical protein